MVTATTIEPVVSPAVAALGFVVDHVTVTPAGRRRVVRVAVDRRVDETAPTTEPTAPVTLDEIAEATRAVGDALDLSDVMGAGQYVLEVTSPGVSRPLTVPRHFRRNVGRLVTFTQDEGSLTARIERADETGVRVRDADGSSHDLPYAAIRKAVVQVEFGRAEADDGDAPHEEPNDEEKSS